MRELEQDTIREAVLLVTGLLTEEITDFRGLLNTWLPTSLRSSVPGPQKCPWCCRPQRRRPGSCTVGKVSLRSSPVPSSMWPTCGRQEQDRCSAARPVLLALPPAPAQAWMCPGPPGGGGTTVGVQGDTEEPQSRTRQFRSICPPAGSVVCSPPPAFVHPFVHHLLLGRQGQHGRARRTRAEGSPGECPLYPGPAGSDSPGLEFSRRCLFFVHREIPASKAPLASQDPRQVAGPPSPGLRWGDQPRATWASGGCPTGREVPACPRPNARIPISGILSLNRAPPTESWLGVPGGCPPPWPSPE